MTLLPVVDVRPDKASAKINPDRAVGRKIARELKLKRYLVVTSSRLTSGPQPSPNEIAEMNVSELPKLGPADSEFLLTVYLEHASHKYIVLGKRFKIEICAVLVDKESSRYLWKDKQFESEGQTGIWSGLFPFQYTATVACIGRVMSSLPKRAKR